MNIYEVWNTTASPVTVGNITFAAAGNPGDRIRIDVISSAMRAQITNGNLQLLYIKPTSSSSSNQAESVLQYRGTPVGYQQITSLATATYLAVPSNAAYAVITAETANVRWRDDGQAPTATTGMLLVTNQQQTFSGDLSTLQFIQATAGAILDVSYYA